MLQSKKVFPQKYFLSKDFENAAANIVLEDKTKKEKIKTLNSE